jgi:membrane-associated phospholipid phosphatase
MTDPARRNVSCYSEALVAFALMGIQSTLQAAFLALLFICMVAQNGFAQQPQRCLSPQKTCEPSPCSGTGDASPCATPQPTPSVSDGDHSVTLKRIFLNLPGDQKAIWTSPFHLHTQDGFWLVPFAATTGVLIGSDQHSMARARSNARAVNLGKNFSDAGLGAFVALPATMYAWSSFVSAPRARETGLLSGEALINSFAVAEALKFAFGRERPTLTDGQGRFFHSYSDPSFPSDHSMLSWTAASVIAHEYPSALTETLAYGGAAAVSISRVVGREHSPSDVVVGGALGWLIGRQVYNAHHDPDLEGALYGNFERGSETEVDPSRLGSTFVPLDSWVYPALKRLAALGYIQSQFTGLEPWTRAECERQIEEGEYSAQDEPPASDIAQTIQALKHEFSDDGQHYYSAQIDSVYSRYTQISGTPLRDSYHFGQTLWNDFGRPYDQGANVITGATASAVAGRFFFYAQGEYQHAPGRGALTDAQRTFIADVDANPVQPASPVNTIDRFYPIDMYAGVKVGDYALTFGKQSLWLAPTEASPLMLSDNADPMYMLRLSRTTPLVLPGFLHWLGQVRGELLFSKLSGHQFPARPFFNLQKVSFHPTKNLEVGFTRASIWAGVGHPFTAGSFLNNFTSLSSPLGESSTIGNRNDPGDRKSGFDFSYRIPGLRNWLSVYSDMYADDDPLPLANPRRSAINPGFYLSHLPGLARLDLRGEATSTQMLTSVDLGPQFLYFNGQYHDANTNKGFLFGSPTGRDARSYQGWSTYHFSATNSLVFSFRQLKASNAFFPGGGTQTDASVRFEWKLRPNLLVDTFVQGERWLIPALSQNSQTNVTVQMQLSYSPHWKIHSD